MGFTDETKARLAQKLDPGLIKQRQGAGGTLLDYIEGHEVQNLLDEVFGADRWKSEVLDSKTIVLANAIKFEVVVRLYVADENGIVITSHDGLGSSAVPPQAGPEQIEFQSKAAATDALKRAAIHFGNAFGRHLYDKDDTDRPGAQAPSGGNQFTRTYAKANSAAAQPGGANGAQVPHGQNGNPTNGQGAAVLPDNGEVVACEECGQTIAGYQSSERSKFRGKFVTAAQLVSDSRRLKGKALCLDHYRKSFPS